MGQAKQRGTLEDRQRAAVEEKRREFLERAARARSGAGRAAAVTRGAMLLAVMHAMVATPAPAAVNLVHANWKREVDDE